MCNKHTRIFVSDTDHPLRQLLSHPAVLFAGYKVPHPLHPYFLLKIQTDGTISPTTALENAATTLIGKIATLETKFKREFAFREVEGGAGGVGSTGDGVTGGAYGGMDGSGAWTTGKDYLDL